MQSDMTEHQDAQEERVTVLPTAVNLDEVTIEKIKVTLRTYKWIDVTDDQGDAVLDDETNAPLRRRDAGTRTTYIQNFVPLEVYTKALAAQNDLTSPDVDTQIRIMIDLILDIWKISEPFMTRKMLAEGLDMNQIRALFDRFFDANRLPTAKAQPAGGTANASKSHKSHKK